MDELDNLDVWGYNLHQGPRLLNAQEAVKIMPKTVVRESAADTIRKSKTVLTRPGARIYPYTLMDKKNNIPDQHYTPSRPLSAWDAVSLGGGVLGVGLGIAALDLASPLLLGVGAALGAAGFVAKLTDMMRHRE